MSDVVSRLLAAIDEVERRALDAAPHRMQLVWSRRAGNARTKAFLEAVADPESVLCLCQSHRDIVARCQDELSRDHGPYAYTLADVVLRALARGYGVEDGED